MLYFIIKLLKYVIRYFIFFILFFTYFDISGNWLNRGILAEIKRYLLSDLAQLEAFLVNNFTNQPWLSRTY